MRGGFGVELQAGGDHDIEVGRVVQVTAGYEQGLHGELARDDVVEIGEEAIALAGVQLDGAKDVGKLEVVDDDAGVVGECSGLDDVHSPCGECAGHIGKEAAAVAGDDGEVEELAVRAEVELNGSVAEAGG